MEIEKCFKRLLIKNPFYGLFCMNLPKVITRDVDTLAVSKNGINCQLNINPDFWGQFTDDEQIALIMHELSHIALQHMFMSKSFSDPRTFNIAAEKIYKYVKASPMFNSHQIKFKNVFFPRFMIRHPSSIFSSSS